MIYTIEFTGMFNVPIKKQSRIKSRLMFWLVQIGRPELITQIKEEKYE